MKRPEGFDPKRPGAPTARPHPPRAGEQSSHQPPAPKSPKAPASAKPPASPKPPRELRPPKDRARPDRDARRALRAAARDRRRYEKAEVRRFTRRQRSRRRVIVALVAFVAVLVVMLAVATFSPILALRHIEVQGTDRLAPAAVQKAVDGQLGTPLALLDMGRMTTELGALPLIESYTTETVPPDTLVITITERHAVAAVERGAVWDQVDAAGVVVDSAAKRPSSLPVMTVSGGVDSVAFRAAAQVLTSLPDGFSVHSIAATTADDVRFVLADGTQVLWGSSERPALKAQVLAALRKIDKPKGTVLYDVSSPDTASYSYP